LSLFVYISAAIQLYSLLIFVRAIGSFFVRDWSHGVWRVLWDFTEPVLAPVRRLLPPMGGLDWSATVVLIVLWLVGGYLKNLSLT
jgi:YggT family protein